MTGVILRASGYTWKCAECGRENYTGPAPAIVRCRQCNGEFEVKSLQHRRAADPSTDGKEVNETKQTELLPLFAASPPASAEDEIPF
jgi:DNA-directed RNA polymerase subunit RPC12/RpoP